MTTTHYGFKLFESADKPTWLENWNQTMTDIDQALYNISTGGGDLPDLTEVVQRIQALEGRMTSAELRLNEDEGAISDLQDTVEELSGLASRLSNLESTVANNTRRISSLETDLGTVKNTDIPTLQTGISQAQTKNTEQDQQISGLDGRVTALENAGGGGATIIDNGSITNYTVDTLNSLISNHDITVINGDTYTALASSTDPITFPSLIFFKNQQVYTVPGNNNAFLCVGVKPSTSPYVYGAGTANGGNFVLSHMTSMTVFTIDF